MEYLHDVLSAEEGDTHKTFINGAKEESKNEVGRVWSF
jgi:hypothetical protein